MKQALINDVQKVLTNLGINDPRVIPALEELWQDEEHLVWTTDDVKERIKQIYDYSPTNLEAQEMLNTTIDRYGRETEEWCFDEAYKDMIDNAQGIDDEDDGDEDE